MHDSTQHTAPEQRGTAASVARTVAVASTDRAVVMTASAYVLYGDQRIRVRLFIDSGAMVSFVKGRLIRQLPGISPKSRVELHLQGVASEHVVVANQYAL